MVVQIPRWPCLIISGQRTGSTALATMVANNYNVKCFIEPNEQRIKIDEFESTYFNFEQKYVVKFMVDGIRNYRIYRNLLNETQPFKIGLFRQDSIAQAASMYVSTLSGVWFNNQLQEVNENTPKVDPAGILEINPKMINQCIQFITKNNLLLRAYRLHYDVTLSYESLLFNESKWKESIKPINYNEIVEEITNQFIKLGKPMVFDLDA